MSLSSFGITYVGVRTKNIEQVKKFVENVLGYKKTHDDGAFVAFTTPAGQRFELFAEDTPDKQYYPLDGAVPGFEVSDFDQALVWLRDHNVEVFEDGVGQGNTGTRWGHFRGPDGNVYEFVHHPALAARDTPD